jgi:excisionase family DNA binding protein
MNKPAVTGPAVTDTARPQVLTAKEARALLGDKVSLGLLYRLARDGTLPSVRVGGRVLFLASDIDRLLAGGPPRAAQAPPADDTDTPRVSPPAPRAEGGFRHFRLPAG